MGGFYIARGRSDEARAARVKRVERSFSKQGFANPVRFEGPSWIIGLYPDFHGRSGARLVGESGFVAAATGTLCYRGKFGQTALEELSREFDGTLPAPQTVSGAFGCILLRQGEPYVFGDPLGLYRIYATQDARVITTSFLAAAESLEHLEVSAQGVYEYVFQEATFGRDTLLANVSSLPAFELNRVTDVGIERRDVYALPEAGFDEKPVEQHLAGLHDRLSEIFGNISRAYGSKISTALSGGFDSRLALAALLDQGQMPEIHVYGRSEDPDVRVARAIAQGEGFELEHIDKSRWRGDSGEAFAEAVHKNYLRFDGLPSDGILDWGGDLETRWERCRAGQLHLNGGGGEVMRNFFYLPDRGLSCRQFLWSFYSRYDPLTCTSRFAEEDYLDSLGAKVQETLGVGTNKLPRARIELLYPFFRCRYWTGRNNSVNSRFGREMTPFLDYGLVEKAVRVPLRWKNFGRIEARLIRRFAPKLARYDSAYGYSFDTEPPLKYRVAASASYLRPPGIRRFSFRVQNRMAARRAQRDAVVPFLSSVVDPALPRVADWFLTERVADPGQFRRLVTLEYFLENAGNSKGD